VGLAETNLSEREEQLPCLLEIWGVTQAPHRRPLDVIHDLPPLYIRVEVSHQLIGRRESISLGRRAGMPVVTFATFVVVSQHALAANHVR
jgi:hypothetical protein